MVQYENVSATLIRFDDKTPYPEYEITRSAAKRSQNVKQAYVEIITGERFAVVVELLPEFDFQSSSHVKISYSVDGITLKKFFVSKSDVKPSGSAGVNDRSRRNTLAESTQQIDSGWMKCGLVFTDLQLDEDAEPTADQIAHDVEMYGKVTIEIQRGTLTNIVPYPASATEFQTASFASKDVVKKSHISNTMKLLGLEKSGQPLINCKFTPAKGDNSAPMSVILLYRSRSALELLKIIPTDYLPPNSIVSPPASGDRKAIVGTKRADPKSTLKLGRRTVQPALKKQRAPGLPLDAVKNAEYPPRKRHKALALPLDFSDDDKELPPKQETGRGDQVSRADADRERQLPQIKSAKEIEHQNQIPASNTPVPQSNASPSVNQTAAKPPPLAIKAEHEDEDDDLVIVSATPAPRAHSTSVPTQAGVSVAPNQHGAQAQRERKKAILNKRLEQLKIEREQLKIERELLEMED